MNLYNKDCLDAMKEMEDNQFDLAIVDPPYGIQKNMRGSRRMGKQMQEKDWNHDIPPKEYFDQLYRVSKNQIIFGANHYPQYMKPTRCWIVWDKKRSELQSYSMHELAATSFDRLPLVVYIHPEYDNRTHPCQKPVELYVWILNKFAKEGDKILDTHLGSGSIAIACHNLGFDLTGYEIDQEYFSAAVKRYQQHKNQLRIF